MLLVMAADYVGAQIARFLSEGDEQIAVLVVDSGDRGGFNAEIIDVVTQANPGVAVYSEIEINDPTHQSVVRSRDIDQGILAWWPHVISEDVISLAKNGFINTHPSYLPYCRGKHSYFWSIVDRTPFGVTLHQVDAGVDSGPIFCQKDIPVTWGDTGESLYVRSRNEIVEMFKENYERIRTGEMKPRSLPEKGSYHHGKELDQKCHLELDKEYTARELIDILRGRMFAGKGEAYFLDNGKKYSVSIEIREEDDAYE